MSDRQTTPRRFSGVSGILWTAIFIASALSLIYGIFVYPGTTRSYGHDLPYNEGMFGPPIEQPIAFSHRLHVLDKEIDCFYCHPYGERSASAGMPSAAKCLGCHDHIIPEHEEIVALKGYVTRKEEIPWERLYYNPDHTYFPHFRHLAKDVQCQECHGEVEKIDRLHQVTFYMGFCIGCHKERNASLECTACHQ